MHSWDIIVDDAGRVWSSQSESLAERHGLVAPTSFDLPSYMVRNLGCVRLRYSVEKGTMRVSFRPEQVGIRAMNRLLYIMLDNIVRRFIVETVEEISTLHSFFSVDDAYAMLAEHSHFATRLHRLAYFKQPLSLERLSSKRLAPLRELYSCWSTAKGNLDVARQEASLKFTGQSFAAVVDREFAFFQEVGKYGNLRRSLDNCVGKSVMDQPDRLYGLWIHEGLVAARYERRALLEIVEATVRVNGFTDSRIRYERLMLPWIARTGDVVSSASVTRSAFPARSDM